MSKIDPNDVEALSTEETVEYIKSCTPEELDRLYEETCKFTDSDTTREEFDLAVKQLLENNEG